MSLTTDLIDHLKTYSGVSGYYDVIGGIRDDLPSFKDADKFLSVRGAGGGSVDPAFGEPLFQVMIGGKQTHTFELEDSARGIIDFVNTNPQIGDILHIVVQSDVTGPLLLSDDRLYYMITIRITQNRG